MTLSVPVAVLLMIVVSLLVQETTAVNTRRPSSPYNAVLAAGKENRDIFGDLVGYYIFAEAGAVVTPAPQWEIFLRGIKQRILEVVPVPVAARNRLRIKANNETQTLSESLSIESSDSSTLHVARASTVTWSIISQPPGGRVVLGTKRVRANNNDRFVINDWVFPLPGKYNILLNASLYWGPSLLFNATVNVDHQPGRIIMTQYPSGYNGSYLTVEPQAQLQDLLGNDVRITSPLITFTVLSGPAGYALRGTYTVNSNAAGRVQLSQVILSEPGTYVVVLIAKLSDNSTVQTPTFSMTVERALATNIDVIVRATGVTRGVFFTTPQYRIRDQVGFSRDTRVNITLTLGLNAPTIVYEGQDRIGYLTGVVSREQVGFDFTFPDLSINLPGNYEIVASLYMDGEVLLQTTYGVVVADLPTFNLPEPLEVNSIGVITVYGAQPLIQPLYLKMSNEIDCVSSASDVASWPTESSTVITTRNVSFVPFASGTGKYLCIGIPSQTAFIPLLVLYEPAFNEPYPLDYTFVITGVSTCKYLTELDVYLYRSAGWDSADVGRSYGCNLNPPVSGTIAPCECFFTLICAEYRHRSFTPANLDIGYCICCKPWVLAAATCSISGFFAGMLYMIYVYV